MNVHCRFGGYDLQPMMMGGIPVTQAPVQMPKNPPFTTYLRPPEPKPHVQGKLSIHPVSYTLFIFALR